MNNNLNLYKENQIEADINNKSKQELLLMLYDGVVNNLDLAYNAILNKNVLLKIQKVEKALAIIEVGLISCINKKVSKEISESLELFYEYAHSRIVLANMNNDVKLLLEIKELFLDLKKCWLMVGSSK